MLENGADVNTEINRFKNLNSYIDSGLYKTASTYSSMSEKDRRDARKRVEETKKRNKSVQVENSDKIYHASSSRIDKFNLVPHYLAEDKGVVFGTPSKVTALTFASPWKDSDLDHYSINDGPLTLKEKYEGALEKVYKGKKGYLYELDPKPFSWNPSLMRSERVSYTVPKILGVKEIPDVYEELLEEQRMNNLRLIKYKKSAREKIANLLSQRGRNQIKAGNFALPGGRYPIHDISHARNALSRVAQHGTQSEQATVRSAAKSKYPSIIIGSEKTATQTKAISDFVSKSLAQQAAAEGKAVTQGASKVNTNPKAQKGKTKTKGKTNANTKGKDATQSTVDTQVETPRSKPLDMSPSELDKIMQEALDKHQIRPDFKRITDTLPANVQTPNSVPRPSANPAQVSQPQAVTSNTAKLNPKQREAFDAFFNADVHISDTERQALAANMKKMPSARPPTMSRSQINPQPLPQFSSKPLPQINPQPLPQFSQNPNIPQPLPQFSSKPLPQTMPPSPSFFPQTAGPSQTQLNILNGSPPLQQNIPKAPTNVQPQAPKTQPNAQPKTDLYKAFRMSDTELSAPNPTGFVTNPLADKGTKFVPKADVNPSTSTGPSFTPQTSKPLEGDINSWFKQTGTPPQNFPQTAVNNTAPRAPVANAPVNNPAPQAHVSNTAPPTPPKPLTQVETLFAETQGFTPQQVYQMDPATRQKLLSGANESGLDPALDPNSKSFKGKKKKNKQLSNESKQKIKDTVENPEEQSSGMSIPLMAGLGIGGIFAGSAIANYVGGHDKSAQVNYRGMTFDDYNKPKEAPPGDKHKMVVLVKSQNKTKLVRFGHRDYKHNYSDSAKNNYLTRSAGIRDKNGNLTKDDPFSPNYWSRKVLWPESKKADGKALGHR